MLESQRRVIQYPKSIRRHAPSHSDLEKLYGDQNQMERVLAKCKRSWQVHYLVRWQPTFIILSHVEENKKIQYTPAQVEKVTQFGPRIACWLKLVSLKASWEPKQSLQGHVHLEADIAALEADELLRAATRPWPAALDAHLTNLERQFFFWPNRRCRF